MLNTRSNFTHFLQARKYELLLFALLQHLFIGVFLQNLPMYTQVIWPINMLILGVASVGVFVEKGKWKNVVRNFLFILVFGFPIALTFASGIPNFMLALNVTYVIYFAFIFWEIIKFLIRPSYINVDVISASACGYLLLIELAVFLLQIFVYANPASFKGISTDGTAATYMDLVYFCSITLTSIGFGDITPNTHHTKLITALFGIAGQFYLVVLMGILISKFSSVTDHKRQL
ncbi:ion channel [Haliscomenobacter sp.]|uniref:ion channel n=1 Tax=Haliscomenobacter sp. TaxID=2717303 RepID=UPI0035940736